MKHAIIAGSAGLLAAGVSLALSTYGAHDHLGLCAVILGYPGAFTTWQLHQNPDRGAYWLVTIVNWLVYFVVLELLVVIAKLKRSRRSQS